MNANKVLITGADGFIGSHLVESLLEKNHHVKAFVFYNSFNSWGWLDSLPKNKLSEIDVYAGDIRDCYCVKNAMKGVGTVYHLAALIGIPFSYHAPDSYVDTNVKGTVNILQASRELSVEKVVITSTSEVYGTAEYIPINEIHSLKGQSPYSASKIAADKMAESFYRSFDTPVAIARPFNTYGPRQSARAIIPTIITQLLNGIDEISLGSLHPTRDLNYVSDTCNGLISIASSDKTLGREINIGSGTEISVSDLANLLIELTGSNARIISMDERIRPPKSEVERLVCDNSLIRELTGWLPKVSLKEGLAHTVEWFKDKKNLANYKWEIYNV